MAISKVAEGTLHGLLSFFFNTMVIALVVSLRAQFAG
jgi:uncharacterized membrane protein